MKFPIFFYTLLWVPLAILTMISVILPFAFLEFNDECKFLENNHDVSSLSFKGFQRSFIVIFILQSLHFSLRKLGGKQLLPNTTESDYNLAVILQVTNLCFSFVFFHLIAKSSCPVTEARVQGFLRIISILGSPILVYGLYSEPPYTVIIAQPVDEEIEIELGEAHHPGPIYIDDEISENHEDIEV